MHEDLTPHSKILRQGSYRFLGPVFLAIAAFTAFMLSQSDAAIATYVIPILFALAGLWFSLVDSRFMVFREGTRLVWVEYHGRKRDTGSVEIPDIEKLIVCLLRVDSTGRLARTRLNLLTSGGRRIELSGNFRLEGRYEDFFEELRRLNPAIELQKEEMTFSEYDRIRAG